MGAEGRAGSPDADAIRSAIERAGFVHLPAQDDARLVDVIEALGTPLYVEEVKVTPQSKALVKSRDGISWHTDHHRADRILWYGRRPAERGGETLVVDGVAAFRSISPDLQEALRRVTLMEHSVFQGDGDRHPMIAEVTGRIRLYCSLWLADDTLSPAEAEAFAEFGRAVERMECHRFLLRRGDILAIDNGRMLHARTPIEGSAVRHLRRYWIAAP